MLEVFRLVETVCRTNSTILITGESGTGKELAAKAIHALGTAPNAPFLPLNVAAIPSDLLESQLFGHRKGAFTGADRDRPGLFLAAGSGTIFLDEIGELPTPTQAKLLRVIETREILPLGDTRPTRIDARVVAATNRDLKSAVDLGQFRADLYYRLNVVQVVMPALRDHAADIPEITQVLVRRLARRLGKRVDEIAATAMDALCRTAWKGNVRELENVLERAIILNDDQIITLADLPQLDLGARSVEDPFQPDDLRQALARAEQTHIETVLEKVGGDKREAASRLGMGLSSLYRKLEEFRARAASA
jgi:transcriptional regulator with PAS, ATPase and Fis domain